MSNTDIKPDDDYRLEDQIGFLLRLANQRHTLIFQANTLEQLTPTQFSALLRIGEMGEVSQNRLGRLTAMDVATIKGVVDRLCKRGLTKTKPDPDDRRRMLISLTKEGKGLCRKLPELGKKITTETVAPLTESEQRNLLRLLRKIS